MKNVYGLSSTYWDSLSPEYKALYPLINPQPRASYTVDVHLSRVEGFLDDLNSDMKDAGGSVELEPDFQRGHVWTHEQGVAYLESVFRGCAPTKILFNCPGWNGGPIVADGGLAANTVLCVDGLQRLTAMRKFIAGELTVFNGLTIDKLKRSPFDASRYTVQIAMYEISTRAELLQFYLNLNAGGVVHTKEEIERVRQLLKAAK